MFSVAAHFNVYVTAAGSEEVRLTAVRRLIKLYPLDSARADSMARGERVLLRDQISENDANQLASSVRALGVRVDLEEHQRALDMVEIDGFTHDEPAPVVAPQENLFFNVSAGLVGLDGADDEPAPSPQLPARSLPASASPASGGTDLFAGLVNATLRDEHDSHAMNEEAPPARPAPPAPPAASTASAALRGQPAPPTPPGIPMQASATLTAPSPQASPAPPNDGQRFGPSGHDSGSMEIQMDRPAPDPMHSVPDQSKETFVVPRCPTHDVPKIGSRCPRCDAEDAVVRGRLFGGALRSRLPLRVALGLLGGLIVGWIATAPMARRAERQVAYIREEARLERLRPLEETQVHAAQLDAQADEESQNGFFRTLGVWALIATVITAGWFRLT